MFKKQFTVYLLSLLLLIACTSGNDENAKEENNNENSEQINVDKGLVNVEITMPASFFENDEERDKVIAENEDEDIKITKNEDGSLTYKMSKAKHKSMMKELETEMVSMVDEMITSDDYPSIQDITYNKSFSEYTLKVDKEAFENSFDAFATFSIAVSSMYYQLFSGIDPDDYQVKIELYDVNTNEVFDEVIYPDDLEGVGEEEGASDEGNNGSHTGG